MHPFMYLMPVAGIGFIFLMSWLAKRVEAQVATSQRWPNVTGTVTHSQVRVAKSTYYPSIRYDYDVAGQRYSSGRYAFGSWSGTRGQVRELIERLPEGTLVPVHYDPANPKFAVLERTAQASTYRWVGWGLGGVLIAVFLLVLLISPR